MSKSATTSIRVNANDIQIKNNFPIYLEESCGYGSGQQFSFKIFSLRCPGHKSVFWCHRHVLYRLRVSHSGCDSHCENVSGPIILSPRPSIENDLKVNYLVAKS